MSIDYAKARVNMVDCQIRTSDVTDASIISAFMQVPRELFVPDHLKPLAYLDEDLDIGHDRYLAAPAQLARLIQGAQAGPDDIVLDVGCATGYSSAILSHVCSFAVALESNGPFATQAAEHLSTLECDNAVVVEGDLEAGYASEGPFDVILVAGAVETIPESLLGQLREGGRLVSVEGTGNSAMACLWINDDGVVSKRRLFNCALPRLPGFSRPPAFVF